MARRRYVSTAISTDSLVAQLQKKCGDAAVILYTWMIPHAEDDGGITADTEELQMLVVPGLRIKTDTVTKAVAMMVELGLIDFSEEDQRLYFPPETFYKYQTYVQEHKRRKTPQNAAEQREAPQIAASPSLSPSPSVTPSPSISPSESDAQAQKAIHPDLDDSDEVGFALEYIQRYIQSHAGMPPSPIEKGAARALERDFGTERCKTLAADFDWSVHPNYLREVFQNPRSSPKRRAPADTPAAPRKSLRYEVPA